MAQVTLLIRLVMSALMLIILVSCTVTAQTTSVSTEYQMTMHARLEAPQFIDDSLLIYNVREGGWAKGPAKQGVLLAGKMTKLQSWVDEFVEYDVFVVRKACRSQLMASVSQTFRGN